MARTQRPRFSPRGLFAWLMVLSVILVFAPQRWTDGFDHLIAWIISPLSHSGRGVALSVTESIRDDSADYSPQQVKQLGRLAAEQENEIVNLRQELQRLQKINSQLTGFRRDLQWAQASFILADVIGSDTGNRRRVLYLNRGSLDHVETGQIVLGVQENRSFNPENPEDPYRLCVVGKIDSVTLKTSTLQLLTDPGFALPAMIEPHWMRDESWRADGMLAGAGMGEAMVKLVEIKGNNVHVGDAVLAVSDPHRLPIETRIGTVAVCEIDDANPVLWKIKVAPAIEPDTLKDVVIVETP